jgi:hypothetical protein
MHGRDEKFIHTLVSIPEGKGPLGRHMHRWDNNINMDLKEIL